MSDYFTLLGQKSQVLFIDNHDNRPNSRKFAVALYTFNARQNKTVDNIARRCYSTFNQTGMDGEEALANRAERGALGESALRGGWQYHS